MSIISSTLPTQSKGGISLDIDDAVAYGSLLTEKYTNAKPFPHIAIDNFIPEELISSLCDNFPEDAIDGEVRYERSYTGLHKRQISPYACVPAITNIFLFFNSAPMLQFLEHLTSIPGLIPDAYFSGGGLHETRSGGKLGIHSDFRINKILNLERRLNIILYLNDNWKEEYGGNLELWDAEMTACVESISPIRNRCVIFNTDPDSNHGHPDPLNTPPEITRRSIALYYYTASKHIQTEINHSKTVYKARPSDSAKVKFQSKKRELRDRRKTWISNWVGYVKNLFK